MRKVNVHALRNRLNSLCGILQKKYNINYGGCCYVAYLIAKHLDRLGIKYKLVIYDYDMRDPTTVAFEVIKKTRMKTGKSVVGNHTCSHYCLYLEGAGIVNMGDISSSSKRIVIDGVSATNIGWIYKVRYWNESYRTNNNETVKTIIKNFFGMCNKVRVGETE